MTELIRKTAISEQTFCRWKAKCSGLEVDHARQMAQLQDDNQRLKKLVADPPRDKTMRQCVPLRKMVKPSEPGPMVEHLERTRCSGTRPCRVQSTKTNGCCSSICMCGQHPGCFHRRVLQQKSWRGGEKEALPRCDTSSSLEICALWKLQSGLAASSSSRSLLPLMRKNALGSAVWSI